MRKLFGCLAVVLFATATLTISALPQPSAELAEVLKRVTEYHATYAAKVSGVTLEEQYQLINVSTGRMQTPVRIASDVVLVNVDGRVASLRDIYAVDTRPTRERTPRILSLLLRPGAGSQDWEVVNGFPAENLFHFALDIIVKTNGPITALQFVQASNQSGLKYKLEGKKKINGVETMALGFEEPMGQNRQYLLGTRRNGRAFGRFWVDPMTGAIHQTELWVESQGERASVSVKFAPHAKLGVLLPTGTTESYEEREKASGPADRAAGSAYTTQFTFEATAKYSNAAYYPLDLSKLKK